MRHRYLLTGIAASLTTMTFILTGCTGQNGSAPEKDSGAERSASSPAESALSRISSSGTVNICTTGDYRPFTYRDPDTKKWSGIDIDMGKSLAQSLDAEAEFVQTDWDGFTDSMQRQCDIGMGGLSITTDRAAVLSMSDPTVQDGKTPITRCGKTEDYDSIAEINDKSVDVITPKGGTNEEFAAENFPQANIIKWDDNNTIFDQIISGDADVMVTDAPETKWVAHTHKELCAVRPDEPLNFSEQGYAVRLGDEEMLHYVNTWLRIVHHDGTYSAAEKKWYG